MLLNAKIFKLKEFTSKLLADGKPFLPMFLFINFFFLLPLHVTLCLGIGTVQYAAAESTSVLLIE
jgi:hypothetical protein